MSFVRKITSPWNRTSEANTLASRSNRSGDFGSMVFSQSCMILLKFALVRHRAMTGFMQLYETECRVWVAFLSMRTNRSLASTDPAPCSTLILIVATLALAFFMNSRRKPSFSTSFIDNNEFRCCIRSSIGVGSDRSRTPLVTPISVTLNIRQLMCVEKGVVGAGHFLF